MALLLLGLVALGGCQDDLDPPTQGSVEVRLSEGTSGAAAGGEIWIDDELVVGSVDKASYTFILPEGTRTLRFEKPCAAVSPSAEIQLDVSPGGEIAAEWAIEINGGLEVVSDIPGAQIFLDGEDTGLVTPATLECVDTGTREIALQLLGTSGGDARTVEVTDQVSRIEFDLEPMDQTRGALVEVLTATECPNCLPVDEAAEDLWEDAERVGAGGITVQMHHPWAGESDPYFTQETFERNAFYGAASGGHPIRVVNGVDRVVGAGDGNIETLREAMEDEIEPYLDGSRGGPLFAIYWLETSRDPEVSVTGTMRVMTLDDVPSPETTEVIGMSYKHNLVTFVRIHRQNETFYRVIRDIEFAGTCADLGLLARGDWADIEFTFDLSGDTEWSEEDMGVLGFVQDTDPSSKEIFNIRHAFVE